MVQILPYLIMAAIEREERGGAIAYWGVKTFRIGSIARLYEHLFIVYSGYTHWQ